MILDSRILAGKRKCTREESMLLEPLIHKSFCTRKPPIKNEVLQIMKGSPSLSKLPWIKIKHRVWASAQYELRKGERILTKTKPWRYCVTISDTFESARLAVRNSNMLPWNRNTFMCACMMFAYLFITVLLVTCDCHAIGFVWNVDCLIIATELESYPTLSTHNP